MQTTELTPDIVIAYSTVFSHLQHIVIAVSASNWVVFQSISITWPCTVLN